MRTKVDKLFDDMEASISKDAGTFKKSIFDCLTKKQRDCERNLTDAAKALDTVEIAYQSETPQKSFIMTRKIEKQVLDLKSSVDKEYQTLEEVRIKLDFDKDLKLPPLPISQYVPGGMTIEYSDPEHTNGSISIEPNSELTMLASVELETEGYFSRRLSCEGLDFIPDGRLVVVGNVCKSYDFLVFDNKLEQVGSFKLPHSPKAVVVVSEKEVTVSSHYENELYFLHIRKSIEIFLIRTVKLSSSCRSLCLKDDWNFVALNSSANKQKPVSLITFRGHEREFDLNLFDFPKSFRGVCTYLKNSEKLVFANNDTIYIFDEKTKTRVVIEDYMIRKPYDVAEGPDGSILVSSLENSYL